MPTGWHRATVWAFVAMAAGLGFQGAAACAREEREAAGAPQDSIPAEVMNALTARFPGAGIRQWTREEENGVVLYDIEFIQDGRNCEADIREDGTYLNFEKAVAAEDLPEAVMRTVQQRYPAATITEIMEITEVTRDEEALEGYEVVLETAAGEQAEITVAPDGRVLEVSGEGGDGGEDGGEEA